MHRSPSWPRRSFRGRSLGPATDLSEQQRRVLELVSRGMTAREVARGLGISPKTVEQHKGRIFRKLGVPNQAAAVRVALGGRGSLS